MMKKTALLILTVLIALVFAGCEMLPVVTQAEAEEAYGISVVSYFTVALQYGLTSTLPAGVAYDVAAGKMTFSKYDISTQSSNTSKYKTMSGTLTYSSNSLTADFTFEGGPVVKLKYTYTAGAKSLTLNANNKDFTVTEKAI